MSRVSRLIQRNPLDQAMIFTGNPAMEPILFDQSRLDPAGRVPDEQPVAPTQ